MDFSAPLVAGRFATFDGLVVEVKMARQDGDYWVALAAAPETPDPRVEPLLDERRTMDADKLEGSLQMALKTPDEVADEIGEINATAGGWAYRVTDYKTDRFRHAPRPAYGSRGRELASPRAISRKTSSMVCRP